MASSDRLREIQRCRVQPQTTRSRHHSQFRAPANLRAILWVAGSIVLAASALGVFKTSLHYDRLTYADHEINAQLERRLPFGAGKVQVRQASVYVGGGLFQIDAAASDAVWQTSLSVISGLKYDPLSRMITIENPETTVSKAVKVGRETGDDAAEYVPENWTMVQAVVRTATNFASGDGFSSMQFENKAKRAVWAMPIFEIPAKDRSRLKDVTIDSIAVEGRSIVLDISDRRLTPTAVIFMVLATGSATLLLVLRSYPDLAIG